MMDGRDDCKVSQTTSHLSLVKLYGLIVVDSSEGKFQNGWSNVSNSHACSGVDASRICEQIYSQSQQKCQKNKQRAIVIHRKQYNKKDIRVWIYESKKINMV